MTSPSSASSGTVPRLTLQGVKIIMALVLSSSHGIFGHEVSLSEKGGGLLEERISTWTIYSPIEIKYKHVFCMGKSIGVTPSMSMPMSCAFWGRTQKGIDGIIARDVQYLCSSRTTWYGVYSFLSDRGLSSVKRLRDQALAHLALLILTWPFSIC
jgi:hypothetical protein